MDSDWGTQARCITSARASGAMQAITEYIGHSDLQPGDCLPPEQLWCTGRLAVML
jgi:DNA-binding FadR family transcriptional regulator